MINMAIGISRTIRSQYTVMSNQPSCISWDQTLPRRQKNMITCIQGKWALCPDIFLPFFGLNFFAYCYKTSFLNNFCSSASGLLQMPQCTEEV